MVKSWSSFVILQVVIFGILAWRCKLWAAGRWIRSRISPCTVSKFFSLCVSSWAFWLFNLNSAMILRARIISWFRLYPFLGNAFDLSDLIPLVMSGRHLCCRSLPMCNYRSHFRQLGNTLSQSVLVLSDMESLRGTEKDKVPATLKIINEIPLIL